MPYSVPPATDTFPSFLFGVHRIGRWRCARTCLAPPWIKGRNRNVTDPTHRPARNTDRQTETNGHTGTDRRTDSFPASSSAAGLAIERTSYISRQYHRRRFAAATPMICAYDYRYVYISGFSPHPVAHNPAGLVYGQLWHHRNDMQYTPQYISEYNAAVRTDETILLKALGI